MAYQMNVARPLTASSWQLRVIGLLMMLIGCFCGVMAVQELRQRAEFAILPVLFPSFIVLYSLHPILIAGEIRATTDSLAIVTVSGRFEMSWKNVRRVEIGYHTLAFLSEERCLAIPVDKFWTGADRRALLQLIDRIMAEQRLAPKRTWRADWRLSNCAAGFDPQPKA